MSNRTQRFTAGLFSRRPSGTGVIAREALVYALILIAHSGCAVGPKYTRPNPIPDGNVPDQYAETNVPISTNAWKIAEPAAHLANAFCWSEFNDPELNRLEELASHLNQDLALAAARLDEARAQVRISRADYYPNITFDPSYSRERTSANSINRGGTTAGQSYDVFNIPFQASWEIDLWGRVRQQVAASRARLEASQDDLDAARLAVQSEVAVDYVTLAALNVEFALVQRNIQAFQRSLDLTVNRRKGGIASDLDVSQAETQLRTTEALLPNLDLQRIQLKNALAILCGKAPSQFTVSTHPLPAPLVTLGAGVPSELLERRPDIAAVERRMASANAQIGVAQAAFYPRVTLNGLVGFQSINAGSVFNWPSRMWAFGPNIDVPLFNGGRLRAELALSHATYAGNVASYRQTVLTAFQEVENELAAQRLLGTDLVAEEAALVSAQRTLAIAENRYRAGLVTYLEVATAQALAFDHERTVVRLHAQQLTAHVTLIKALGGGWQDSAALAAKL
jgi:multidrug efflux system outer membrane protein